MSLHLWRTHGGFKDRGARHLPVHVNKQGREVYSRRPRGHPGFEEAKPWLVWLKWKEAVVAVAVGSSSATGFRVEGWQEVLQVREVALG